MRSFGRFERVAFQCQTALFALAAGMVARILGGPCYTRDVSVGRVLDGLDIPFILEEHVFPDRPRTLMQILRMSAGHTMRRLIVVTGGLKSAYASSGIPEDRILVLPDGVRPDLFDLPVSQEEARSRLGLPIEGKLVGYAGRFHTMGEEKGIAELIRSYQYLPEGLQRITRFVLVGGPLEAAHAYRALIEAEGLPASAYIFLGSLPYGEIPLALRALDVGVIPFPWTTHYAHYASPLKLYEYMAAGIPIVATDLPSLREVLENGVNALLVPPDDSRGLAGGILRLLESEELGSQLATAAKARVQECSWDARAKKIRGVLDEGNSTLNPHRLASPREQARS
jgi:glycosyltransferase involved in cell wall biosynthesis